MKRPIGERTGTARTWCATGMLWMVIASLPLLSACGQPSGPASPSGSAPASHASASASSGAGSHEVALVYTYREAGVSGIAGGSARDGSVVWRAAIGHANWAPTIVGNTLYACVHAPGFDSQNTVAVRVATGQVLWRTTLPGYTFNDVLNADATTVVVDAGENGLYTLNPQDGTIRWHLARIVDRKPLIQAGVVYALVTQDRFSLPLPLLAAYRASDGKFLWTAPYGSHNGRIELNFTAVLYH